jgi:serine/threonine protein kinase
MSPETHQRVRQLFDEALERPEAERILFLQRVCAGNSEVFGQVAQLLAAHEEAINFLEGQPALPQHMGRYIVTGELGRGAMGIVYEAIDPLIGRKVAVKVIRLQALTDGSETGYLRAQLFREARSAGLLSHPGIVIIFDVGQEGDLAFIAMERVEGPSLQQILASEQEMERSRAFDILRQTAVALDYAHRNGVVHRDVKPANIMLHKGATVKLTDFGIAKVTGMQQLTHSGMVAGTPGYMSPEQLRALPVDGRSDQFSLAVIAFQMLTGVMPFSADSFATMVHQVVYENRPSARGANSSLSQAADVVFFRGLSQRPEERYGTCAEFVAELEATLQEKPSTSSFRAKVAQDKETVVSDSALDRAGARGESGHRIDRQHKAPEDTMAGASQPAPAVHLRALPRVAATLQYLIPSLAITLVVRWYLDTSPVTRDKPLSFSETSIVFIAVLMVVAVVRWVGRLLKRR